jgi:chromosome segregation ATPase
MAHYKEINAIISNMEKMSLALKSIRDERDSLAAQLAEANQELESQADKSRDVATALNIALAELAVAKRQNAELCAAIAAIAAKNREWTENASSYAHKLSASQATVERLQRELDADTVRLVEKDQMVERLRVALNTAYALMGSEDSLAALEVMALTVEHVVRQRGLV